jgi:hypothetical protein
MMIKAHLLVTFSPLQGIIAASCALAASKRFPTLRFHVGYSGSCKGVFVNMETPGPDSLPSDDRLYEQVQQFCAGYWYAVKDRG